MLEDLIACLGAPELEDAFVRMQSASWRGDDLELELEVLDDSCATLDRRWRVHCSEVADHSLAEAGGDVSFHEFGHVAGRQHSDPTRSLLFRSRPSSIPTFLGKLWLAHEEAAGRWIPLHRYLNQNMPLVSLLEAGNGLLADGPRFLVEAYAEAVADTGAGAYLMPERRSRFGEGARLGTLVVGGAFVVAAGFSATRVPRSP